MSMNPTNNQLSLDQNRGQGIKPDNKSLAESHSSRRLSRKPSANLFNSPKSKLRDQVESECQMKKFQSPVPCRFVRNSAQLYDAQMDNNYGILPKNAHIVRKPQRFQSPINSIRNVISIEKIQTESTGDFIPFINMDKKVTEQISPRRPSKTSKQFCPPMPKKQDSFNDHYQTSQTTSSVNFMREENLQLLTENIKMKKRVQDLKQENQYMYSQIEGLLKKIKELAQENTTLAQTNIHSCEKIEELKQEVNHFKQLYKGNEILLKNYSVLQHVYSKLKYENQGVEKKNQALAIQNQKLMSKVALLTKLLDQSPAKSKKPRSKSKSRQRSPAYNKENQESNALALSPRAEKLNKTSRKDESIFQLSPQ